MDRRLQLRRSSRALRQGLPGARWQSKSSDPIAVGRVRDRRPPHHHEPQLPAVAAVERHPAHRHRNPGDAHLDGLAQESLGVRAAAVPLIVCVAPDAGVARSAIGSIHKSISAHARCARGADEGVRLTRTFMAL